MSDKKLSTNDEAYKASMLPLITGGLAGAGILIGGAFAAVQVFDDMTSEQPPAASSSTDPSDPSSTPASPSDAPGDEDDDSSTSPGRGDEDAPENDKDSDGDQAGTEDEGNGSFAEGDDVRTDSNGTDYVVREIIWGDTLSEISLETGISVDRLADYNHIENPDLIYAGSALRVPSE